MNAMFGILFRVEARPDLKKELLEFLKWDCQVCAESEPETLSFNVFPDPEDVNGFYVYEAYEDLAALNRHKEHEPNKKWPAVKAKCTVANDRVLTDKDIFLGEPLCSVEDLRKVRSGS